MKSETLKVCISLFTVLRINSIKDLIRLHTFTCILLHFRGKLDPKHFRAQPKILGHWATRSLLVFFPGNLYGSTGLGPSINGLVTDGNTKLCCRGYILTLFQCSTANKIDSEHTRDYKRLLPVCEAEILRVTVKQLKLSLSIMLISDDFRLKVPKIAKKGT